jgi:hypothetical protein
MSRSAGPRGRRAGRPPSGGLLPWALSLPARMHLRWLVILVVTAAAMGAYGHVLLTAAPMPPGKAPAAGTARGHRPAAPPSPTGTDAGAHARRSTASPTSEVG